MSSVPDLRRLLSEMGIPPESERGCRMTAYLSLLEKWNARINLTGSTEWRVVGPLIREAIWAAGIYPGGAAMHLDIGSGAGFPALLLKILHPQVEFELVESREKKAQFLALAAHHLGLQGVSAKSIRLSDYLRDTPAEKAWDVVSWKALKLGTEELQLLRRHTRGTTRFWMFHGKAPALKDSGAVAEGLRIVRKEQVPGTKESYLSIYRT